MPNTMVLCSDQWLHNVAEQDRLDLSNAVRVRVCDPQCKLDELPQYIDFRFLVFNGSVHTISVKDSIGGQIGFRQQVLMGGMRILSQQNKAINLIHGREASFIVRVQLSKEEAELIRNSQDPISDKFHFGQLKTDVHVESHPEVQSQALILPDGVPLTSIAGLRSQYAATIGTLETEKNALKAQVKEQVDPAVHVIYELDDFIVRNNQMNLDNPKPIVLVNEGATAFDIQISDIDLGRNVIRFPVVGSLSKDVRAEVLVNVLHHGIVDGGRLEEKGLCHNQRLTSTSGSRFGTDSSISTRLLFHLLWHCVCSFADMVAQMF